MGKHGNENRGGDHQSRSGNFPQHQEERAHDAGGRDREDRRESKERRGIALQSRSLQENEARPATNGDIDDARRDLAHWR
jgi:hypothetical protein